MKRKNNAINAERHFIKIIVKCWTHFIGNIRLNNNKKKYYNKILSILSWEKLPIKALVQQEKGFTYRIQVYFYNKKLKNLDQLAYSHNYVCKSLLFSR